MCAPEACPDILPTEPAHRKTWTAPETGSQVFMGICGPMASKRCSLERDRVRLPDHPQAHTRRIAEPTQWLWWCLFISMCLFCSFLLCGIVFLNALLSAGCVRYQVWKHTDQTVLVATGCSQPDLEAYIVIVALHKMSVAKTQGGMWANRRERGRRGREKHGHRFRKIKAQEM